MLPLLANPLAALQRAKISRMATDALVVAVERGHSVNAAAQLLRDGAVVNSHKHWGRARASCSLLFIAAACGDKAMVRLLLTARADVVKGREQDGASALHAAVRNGEAAVAALLLSAGASALLGKAPSGESVLSCESASSTAWLEESTPDETTLRTNTRRALGRRATVGLEQVLGLSRAWRAWATSESAPATVAAESEEHVPLLEARAVALGHVPPLLLASDLGFAAVVQ